MDTEDINLDADDDNVWLPDDIDAKKLDTKDRDALGSDTFAVPGKRKLPINDANHVRNALARFNQTKGLTPAERATARAKIHRAAKKFGIDVKAEGDEDLVEVHAMRLVCRAVSLDLPHVDGHPNRMPFTGILTRVDQASDKAPQGSNGKRVLLTKAAAESALDSLLGMGVDLKKDLDGHDAQNKVGIITAAKIDGDALRIEGFIYASDFPREALRIHMDQANLGFSFEAQNLAVESLDTDPMVVKRCVFTGAAILLKNEAAYQTTALAAAKAKEHEMDEIQKAVAAAMEAALAPLTKTMTAVAAAQEAQAAVLDELKKAPPQSGVLHAVAATVAKVEPHANRMEAVADTMEKEGIGLHETEGHVNHLRRMAGSMRADAAVGKIPHAYHGSGSYYASADPRQQQQQVHQQQQAPAVKIEDVPEFKTMKASFDQQADALKKAQDEAAAMKTQFSDLSAQMKGLRPAPDRKTVTPEIQTLLARVGLAAPEDGNGTLAVGKLDAALANMPNMDLQQRMYLKTQLARAGVIPMNNGNGQA